MSHAGQRIQAALRRHGSLLTWCGWIVFAPIFLWFLGWILVGDEILIVRWGAYVAPWLALILLVAGAIFAAGRKFWMTVASLALTILILVPILPSLSPARWLVSTPPGRLRVMTFNTSMLDSDFPAIAALIAHERPDVVMLQQIVDLAALKDALRRLHLDYESIPERTSDTAILSLFPLSEGHDGDHRTTAVATIGTCRLRLWSLHAPHGHMSVADQAAYLATVALAVRGEQLPVIAAGDLNSTEYNSVQRPLRDELHDAFEASGSGFGLTFPSSVRRFGTLGPLFRLDHIFVRGLVPVSASVLRAHANSDHYPVVATFNLARAACAPRD